MKTPPFYPQFFSDFWEILIEVAKSIDQEETREKISGAYIYLLDFLTHRFLYQQNAPFPKDLTPNSTLNHNLIQFAKKYQWDLKIEDETAPSSQKVVTPVTLDLILLDYINYTQGDLPNELDFVKVIPSQTGSLKARGKKFGGSFFTPSYLARVLVQKVFSNFLATGSGQMDTTIAVLDPSMGAGIFLVESARILLQQLTRAFPQKTRRELIVEILNNRLFGMDILPEAVQTAKSCLILWAAAQISPADLPNFVGTIDFKKHLLCVDTLSISAETLFRTFGCKSFPILVGNPPFLHTRTGLLDKGFKKQLKSAFSDLTKGQWDLCTLFIRRVGDFLAPFGHWGFVLPARLLSNEQYEPIRHWIIQNFHIRSLVDAGKAFRDAGVEIFLLVAGPRGREDGSISFEKFDGSGSEKVGEIPLAEVNRFPFSAIPWLPQEAVRNLVLKISDQPRHLGEIVSITRGFECGFNDPSIGSLDQLVAQGHSQVNLLPIIKGSNIYPFSILQDTPPIFCVPEWTHPAKFKTPELFTNVPKIVIRFVANDIVAAIDEIGYMNTNGVYNLHARPPLQHGDLWWILALLNSGAVSFWFKSVFSNRDKLYPHIQKNQLEAIPIPQLTRRDQEILVQISRAQHTYALSSNLTFQQGQVLNSLCIALYLTDNRLEDLLSAIETRTDERLTHLVDEIMRQYQPIFKPVDEII